MHRPCIVRGGAAALASFAGRHAPSAAAATSTQALRIAFDFHQRPDLGISRASSTSASVLVTEDESQRYEDGLPDVSTRYPQAPESMPSSIGEDRPFRARPARRSLKPSTASASPAQLAQQPLSRLSESALTALCATRSDQRRWIVDHPEQELKSLEGLFVFRDANNEEKTPCRPGIAELREELQTRGIEEREFVAWCMALHPDRFDVFIKAMLEGCQPHRWPSFLILLGMRRVGKQEDATIMLGIIQQSLNWQLEDRSPDAFTMASNMAKASGVLRAAIACIITERRWMNLSSELTSIVLGYAEKAFANAAVSRAAIHQRRKSRPVLQLRDLVRSCISAFEEGLQSIESVGRNSLSDEDIGAEACRLALIRLQTFARDHVALRNLQDHTTAADQSRAMRGSSAAALAEQALTASGEGTSVSSILEELNKRKEHEYLVDVWTALLRNETANPDNSMLTSVATAFIHLGKADIALGLLEHYLTGDPPAGKAPVQGDVHLLRGTLKALSSERDYEHFFSWLRRATGQFKIVPDGSCIDIVISTARSAASASMSGRQSNNASWQGAFPALYARDIFQAFLVGRYPDLPELAFNPLEQISSGWVMRGEMSLRKVERWLLSPFQTEQQRSAAVEAEELQQWRAYGANVGSMVDSRLLCTYATLLQRLQSMQQNGLIQSEAQFGNEILQLLSYHKVLGIRPSRKMTTIACLEIARTAPPASTARWGGGDGTDSPAGPLHHWLVDWLGADSIPTEEEMARTWNWSFNVIE
jgi:hypothetical protein